jgi:regulator of sigma E protease
MNYLIVVVCVALVILIHELGHLLAAKLAKIPIAVFSVGFGPKIFGKRFGDTEYRLSAIPLGGYCLPAVENLDDWKMIAPERKIIFSIGGPFANLLFAVILFYLTYLFAGTGVIQSMGKSLLTVSTFCARIVEAIINLPAHPESLAGPVGIVASGGAALKGGLSVVGFASLISINLAVANMIPIPALDGGKILIALAEKFFPSTWKIQMPLQIAGWIVLAGLLVGTLAFDLWRLVA